MDLTAFELVEDLQGFTDEDPPRPIFMGGDLTLPEGEAFDVRKELDDGDGLIVIDTADQFLVDLLRAYPALKEVPVPEGREATVGWVDRTAAQIRDEAKRREFQKLGSAKGPIAERLTAHDQALAAGDAEAAAAIVAGEDVPTGNPAGDDTTPGGAA